MKKIFCSLIFLLLASTAFAQDPTLPDVENVRIEGDTLVWDALDGATGYNVLLNRRYYDTVRGVTSYDLSEAGKYSLTPFNDAGEYGDDYGPQAEYEGGDPNSSVQFSYDFNTLIVRNTCVDVGPGESCVARCPTSYTHENHRTIYPRYISGGACSTSDIVESDSWVGHSSYHCTVPTFSGEVIAQAICRTR